MTTVPESSPHLVLVCNHTHLLWLLFPDDLGMSIAAFLLMAGIILIIVIECIDAGEPHPYVPKKCRPPQRWTEHTSPP